MAAWIAPSHTGGSMSALDRLQVLFEQPSRISEARELSVRSELPIAALNRIVE